MVTAYTDYRTHHFAIYILYIVYTDYRTHHSATTRNSFEVVLLSWSRYSTPNFHDYALLTYLFPQWHRHGCRIKHFLIAEYDTSTWCCISSINHSYVEEARWPTSNPDTITKVIPEVWTIHCGIYCLVVRHEFFNKIQELHFISKYFKHFFGSLDHKLRKGHTGEENLDLPSLYELPCFALNWT